MLEMRLLRSRIETVPERSRRKTEKKFARKRALLSDGKSQSTTSMMNHPVSFIAVLTSLVAAVCIQATPGPQDSEFNKAENIIKNGCVCGRTLYEPNFESRRLNVLNSCVEKLFDPSLKYKGSVAITSGCPEAAILALQNLRQYSTWKTTSFDASQQKALDACFYGGLGWRNNDGSANVEALMKEITKAQKAERDRGVASLRKANREADAEKKQSLLDSFNESTFAYKFLTHLATRARDASICNPKDVSQHYRCAFNDCFSAGLSDIAI